MIESKTILIYHSWSNESEVESWRQVWILEEYNMDPETQA